MGTDVLLQAGLVVLTLFLFYLIQSFPKRALQTSLRTKSRTSSQASNRHFISGAQLLSRARTTRNRATSLSLAASAVSEADKALSITPKDPAAHILRALALDLMGRGPAALKSLDAALSPPAARMLSDGERADALVKRAEIRVGRGSRKRREVDGAVEDLEEAARLGGGGRSAKAYCLLGECYEAKGMMEEAREVFGNAVRLEPGSGPAKQGLDRVGNSRE